MEQTKIDIGPFYEKVKIFFDPLEAETISSSQEVEYYFTLTYHPREGITDISFRLEGNLVVPIDDFDEFTLGQEEIRNKYYFYEEGDSYRLDSIMIYELEDGTYEVEFYISTIRASSLSHT